MLMSHGGARRKPTPRERNSPPGSGIASGGPFPIAFTVLLVLVVTQLE